MEIESLAIAGPLLLRARRIGDGRGWFSETFREDALTATGIADRFVQDNQSFSSEAGTLRGLHYQDPPHAQAKLVRVLAGAIYDVAVDLRPASPDFGRHIALHLTADANEQLYVPPGFAHGFCTLQPDTTVAYKVSAYYSAAHDRGLRWDDPTLGISWPMQPKVLSDKDRAAPVLAAIVSPF